MQQQHGGVTPRREEFFDDPDLALELDRRPAERYREVNLDSELRRAAIDDAGKTKRVARSSTLPERATDYDPELVESRPRKWQRSLSRPVRSRGSNISRIMQEYPGKSDGFKHHGSSSGKKHRKPRPALRPYEGSIHDAADTVAVKPPAPRCGRISTEAYGVESADPNAGNILDVIGKELYAGARGRKSSSCLATFASEARSRRQGARSHLLRALTEPRASIEREHFY